MVRYYEKNHIKEDYHTENNKENNLTKKECIVWRL